VEQLPNGQALLIEGAGHLLLQEQPDSVTKIGDFLAGQTP